MPPIGFSISGLQPGYDHIPDILRDWFGYNAVIDGNRLEVPINDPALQLGPPRFLEMHHRIDLTTTNFTDAAEQMVSLVPRDFDGYDAAIAEGLPDHIGVPAQLGDFSRLSAVKLRITLTRDRTALIRLVAQELLPLMTEVFEVRYVTPITLNATGLQRFCSFVKCTHQMKSATPDSAEEIITSRCFDGVLPNVFVPLDLLDAMTRHYPVVFSLPVRKDGCSWHFGWDGFVTLPHLFCDAPANAFINWQSPRAGRGYLTGLRNLNDMGEHNVWSYMKELVAGINGLFQFLLSPLTFANENTRELELMRQLQALGFVSLLLADLQELNCRQSVHSRISFSFAAIEKMANLRNSFLGRNTREALLVQKMMTMSQCWEARQTISDRLGDRRPKLAATLRLLLSTCYSGIHRHLRGEIEGEISRSEQHRVSRLWKLRNLHHGTFLERGAFQDLFENARGVTPADLPTLPFMLTFCLLLDTNRFVRFDPSIRQ